MGISLLLPAVTGILGMGWTTDRAHQLRPGHARWRHLRRFSVSQQPLTAHTSSLETELISAARDSEKEAENRFLAPWMLRLMICPFSSSFCSFRFLLSCSHTQTTHSSELIQPGKGRQGLSS